MNVAGGSLGIYIKPESVKRKANKDLECHSKK